jgi:hypothetical protein
MRKWLIKLLGGVTPQRYYDITDNMHYDPKRLIEELQEALSREVMTNIELGKELEGYMRREEIYKK